MSRQDAPNIGSNAKRPLLPLPQQSNYPTAQYYYPTSYPGQLGFRVPQMVMPSLAQEHGQLMHHQTPPTTYSTPNVPFLAMPGLAVKLPERTSVPPAPLTSTTALPSTSSSLPRPPTSLPPPPSSLPPPPSSLPPPPSSLPPPPSSLPPPPSSLPPPPPVSSSSSSTSSSSFSASSSSLTMMASPVKTSTKDTLKSSALESLGLNSDSSTKTNGLLKRPSKSMMMIKMNLSNSASKLASTTKRPSEKKTVAEVFNDDDQSDEEEDMPPEAKMRMRNIGKDTPTPSGPNSFNKTKLGFCNTARIFEKQLERGFDNDGNKGPNHNDRKKFF